MSGKQKDRFDNDAFKRTPSKAGSLLSLSEVYSGSGSKHRSRQSLRTPQQHVPLKPDDREKNRRASKSFILMDQSDQDTPRANIEAFMGVAESVQKSRSSFHIIPGTERKRLLQAVTPEKTSGNVFKAPRVRELAAEHSGRKSRVSSPGSKLTPRSNIFNLLQTGDEQTPVMRTVNLTEARSSTGMQNLTTVKDAGQRVSVSPIYEPSVRSESKRFTPQSSVKRKAKRRSFHLNSLQPHSPQLVPHSGQRVSVSPLHISDNGTESTVRDLSQPRHMKPRGTFHFNPPQFEEMDQEDEEIDNDADELGSDDSYPDNLKERGNSLDGEQRKSLGLENQRANGVTGTLELGVEHTSLVVGEKSATQTQRTGLTADISDIAPTDHNLSRPRKSSISRHVVSIEHGISSVQPVDLGEYELMKDAEEQTGDSNVKNKSGDHVNTDIFKPGIVLNRELDQLDKSDQQSQIKAKDQILMDDMREVRGPLEDVHNLKRRASQSKIQERVLDAAEVMLEKDVSDEAPATANVDPASVYDLSEESSASREENSVSVRAQSRGSISKQKLSSERRKTPVYSANKTDSMLAGSASRRKRLEFSEPRPSGSPALGSPDQVDALQDQPRSSTPINRSRRFFHSTKIQRSVTDYFQGDQDLASSSSAMTPKMRNLFSDISPIRAQAGERTEAEVVTRTDSDHEQPIHSLPSSSKKTSKTDEKDVAISQSSDGELPSFSSLATPHIDLRKRVIMSSLHRKPLSVSRSKTEKSHPIPKRNTAKTTAKQRAKASIKNLPRRTIKYLAELHSDMKLSKDAIDEIEKVSEHFWTETFQTLEAYAQHAGRKSVQDSDAILLMKTERLISGTEDLHNKIRQLMPMEIRRELIPCAYRNLNKK